MAEGLKAMPKFQVRARGRVRVGMSLKATPYW